MDSPTLCILIPQIVSSLEYLPLFFIFKYRILKWFIFECYNLFCRFGPMETRKFETLMLPWQEIKFLMTNWRFSNRFPNLATNWFPSSRMQKKRKQLTKSNPRQCTSKNFLVILQFLLLLKSLYPFFIYRISANSFRPWIVSVLLCTVTKGHSI